eukprot:3548780-Pleurochrysis_carterae.AAC.1
MSRKQRKGACSAGAGTSGDRGAHCCRMLRASHASSLAGSGVHGRGGGGCAPAVHSQEAKPVCAHSTESRTCCDAAVRE